MSQSNSSEYGQHFTAPSIPTRTYAEKSVDSNSCTLIYSLDPGAPITFDQFTLIVRSLHSYKVKYFKTYLESNIIEVKLDYNASMKNVRAKLGNVPGTVIKANPYIQTNEISELESLRSTFRFGNEAAEEEPEVPVAPKKRKYKKVSTPYIQV